MPIRRLLLIPLMAAPLLLAGCAAMNADECRQADWRFLGLRDGQKGEPLAMLDNRVQACAEHKVSVNTQQYFEGRNQGLAEYCRLDQAARYGLEGKAYHGVCSPGIDGEFRRRHALGWEVNQARTALNNLVSRQRGLENELSKAKNDDERQKLRRQIRDLDWELSRARERVRTAEWNLDRMR